MANQAFPDNFLWGASTAAHQVEGNNHNQWSEWEQGHASHLAATAKQRYGNLPSWERIKDEAVRLETYISGDAVDHYGRFEEDFDIVQNLNMNAFRFSIEWSRIEPSEGKWNDEAINHYHRYIGALKKRNIEPILTLWHWTEPAWFTQKGSFEKRSNLQYFERFVAKMAEEYGSDVNYVLTLNEPTIYTPFGYLAGKWPPGKKNPFLTLWVLHNLISAHKNAYRILKQANPQLRVGITAQLANFQPAHTRFIDRVTTKVAGYLSNWWFLDRIRRYQDFIGLNYYFTNYVGTKGVQNPSTPASDLGWYMEPAGIGPLLQLLWERYHKPIIIAENGLADAQDANRQWWLEQTVEALKSAMDAGVDVRGYLHWSLLDNFEWAEGWWPQFGLVSVDRNTMERTIRPSAKWLSERIRKQSRS